MKKISVYSVQINIDITFVLKIFHTYQRCPATHQVEILKKKKTLYVLVL